MAASETLDRLHPQRLATAEAVLRFALAGNSTFTLRSTKTGKRFTYRVKLPGDAPDPPRLYFVSVLNGCDNETNYLYLGELRRKAGDGWSSDELWPFNRGRKSRVNEFADSMVGFTWFWRHIQERGAVPDGLEVWHEGRCGRCNRKLTDPESIARGIGPDCAEQMGIL